MVSVLTGGEDEPLTEAEYEARMLPPAQQLVSVGDDFADLADFGEPAFTDDMNAGADDAADSADAFDGITPPEILGSEHEQLIDDARAVESGFRDAATASEENDSAAADDALGVAESAMRDAGATFDAIGVEVGQGF